MTKKEKLEELKTLLLLETGREDEGILTMAKKTFTSDLHQRKIARITELLEEI